MTALPTLCGGCEHFSRAVAICRHPRMGERSIVYSVRPPPDSCPLRPEVSIERMPLVDAVRLHGDRLRELTLYDFSERGAEGFVTTFRSKMRRFIDHASTLAVASSFLARRGDGAIIGHACVLPDPSGAALFQVFVDPGERGARVGSRLHAAARRIYGDNLFGWAPRSR